MFIVCRMEAHMMNKVASAKWRPGQILMPVLAWCSQRSCQVSLTGSPKYDGLLAIGIRIGPGVLEKLGRYADLIETVRGIGYRMRDPADLAVS